MASIADSIDFTSNALADNSVTVTRTPVTKSLDPMGDEILTEGSTEDISVILHLRKPIFVQNKHRLCFAYIYKWYPKYYFIR